MANRFLICGLGLALAGAWLDVRGRRIPNWLTYSGLALALAARAALAGLPGLEHGITGGLTAGAIMLVIFLAGGMGGGDVKLMAGVGAWAGMPQAASILLASAIAGGVLALGFMVFSGQLRRTLRNTGELVRHHLRLGIQPHPLLNVSQPGTLRLPYGLAIALGTLYCAATGFAWR